MSKWIVIITGALYAIVAVEQIVKGNGPMGTVYAGYALANVGLMLAVS